MSKPDVNKSPLAYAVGVLLGTVGLLLFLVFIIGLLVAGNLWVWDLVFNG